MGRILTDLSLRLSANSAELQNNLNIATTRINKFGKDSKTQTGKISGFFNNIQKKVGGVAKSIPGVGTALAALANPAVLAAGGVAILVKVFKDLNAAMVDYSKTTDAMRFNLAGLVTDSKTAYKELQKTLKGKLVTGANLVLQGRAHGNKDLIEQGKLMQEEAKAQISAVTGYKKTYEWKLLYTKVADEARKIDLASFKLQNEIAKLEEKRSEAQKDMNNTSLKAVEREKARVEFLRLNTKIAKDQKIIYQAQYDIKDKLNNLSFNTDQTDKDQYTLEKQILDVDTKRNKKAQTALALKKTIVTQAAKELKDAKTLEVVKSKVTKYEKEQLEALVKINNTPQLAQGPNTDLVSVDSTIEKNKKLAENAKNTTDKVLDASDLLKNAMGDIAIGLGENIGNVLSGAGSVFNGLLSIIVEFAKALGKMMIKIGMAGIALKKLIINPFLAVGAGIALVALTTFAGKKIQGINPIKMAEGGLVTGDSLVRVGEYAGARSNPEVIAPLSKLQGMLFANKSHLLLSTIVSGQDIKFILEETDRVTDNSH